MIYIAPSIYRAMDVRTATALYGAMSANPTDERVVWNPMWNDGLIARSRSLMATKFITAPDLAEADVMVMIDDDIVFEPADLWKIVEGARQTRGIYGGAYVTRGEKPHLASRFLPNSGMLDFHQTFERRPVEFQYLSTGFWAVHRDVVEAVRDGEFRDADGTHRMHLCSRGGAGEFYPLFDPFTVEEADGQYHYLSEDWAFCERARQLGVKVWCDQSIILQHMGLYPFTVADLDLDDNGLPSTGTDLLEVRGKHEPTGEPLVDTLIADIAEWSQETEGDIARLVRTGSGTLSLKELWEQRTEPEAEWYRREDVGLAYMLDLAAWHHVQPQPFELVKGLAGKRVLDYGAGIGTLALYAAREGAEVMVWEPNRQMSDFVAWRAAKYGLQDSVCVDYAAEYRHDGDDLDAVVAWHLFEHVESPEALLDQLLGMLGPDGLLITDSDFQDEGYHPMHHEHADWDGVLRSRGLIRTAPGVYEQIPAAVAV